MKRRGVKVETASIEPAPAASGAAAPSPDDVPLPKRMRTQSQKLSELDDLDLGPVPAVEAATVQAEAPSDGAQPTLDTAPRGTEGTETERIGSGELSSKSDLGAHREGALEMPPPAPPAARRMPSLPRLGLHINIPQSNPGTPSEDRPGSARSLESHETGNDQMPPVTPATAISVLPLHAAVAAGKVEEVQMWLDVHAPLPSEDGLDREGKSVSTPQWPPRPVSDILGPGSASREPPYDQVGDAADAGPGANEATEDGENPVRPGIQNKHRFAGELARFPSIPKRDSDRSSAGVDGVKRGPVDTRNEHGNTALAVAAALADPAVAAELTTLLLEHGASPLVLSSNLTPLHWAAQQGNSAALTTMAKWEGGRAVDARAAETGETPLMAAASAGQLDCCLSLLTAGADPLAVNVDGVGILALVASKVSQGKRSKVRAAVRLALLNAAPQLRVLLLHHEDCGRHISFKPHQESPERISAILAFIAKGATIGLLSAEELLVSTEFDQASKEHLIRCHSEEYISVITQLGEQVANTPVAFTPYYQGFKGLPQAKQKKAEFSDTFFSPGTMAAALRAAGGVVHAVESVLKGHSRTAFVCVRPPGHHAGVDGATAGAPSSGFSIVNNAMIGALHALEGNHGRLCKRVAVVDFDVHHGNGTEEIARAWHAKHRKAGARAASGADDSDLFFASIHLADDGAASSIEFYPGTGTRDDLHHNIVNVCVPPMWIGAGTGGRGSVSASGGRARSAPKKNRDDELDGSGKSLTSAKVAEAVVAAANPHGGRGEWMKRLRERVLPPLRAFKPDLLIISAGFDAANHDVGNMGVDKTGKRLAGINLQPDDYEEMTACLCGAAGSSNARVVSVLEGGYGYLTGDPKEGAAGLVREGLAACVVGHVRALAGLGLGFEVTV